MSTVDVCLATYKRPELLWDALQSLANQKLGSIQMRIIVVDNDRDETARVTVESFRSTVMFEVIYDVEPCQSVSMARNRALSHVRADYIAFLDDDEIAPTDWLSSLLGILELYKADVVFAPVWGILPPDAPKWAQTTPIFQRPRKATGTSVKHGGAGNVMIRRDALGSPIQLFDLAYGLSGGEDIDYFYRLYQMGRRMVWCDEALVSEQVPANRLTLKWVRQRAFSSGQTFVRIFVRQYTPYRKITWFVFKLMQLLAALLLMPFVRIVSYSFYVRLLVRVMGALGQMSVAFSDTVYEVYHAKK
jgi:succinoglycan biosynthesis protein ExoM